MSQTNPERSRFPVPWVLGLVLAVLGIGFLTTLVLVFAGQNAAQERVRQALLRDLNELKPPYRVRLDGRDTTDPTAIVRVLRAVTSLPAHHSGPVRPVHLEIGDGEHTVRVTLAEDSQRSDEFWVFRSPRQSSGASLGQEAGQTTDSRLRSYLGSSK
jgi:hypothetical protein